VRLLHHHTIVYHCYRPVISRENRRYRSRCKNQARGRKAIERGSHGTICTWQGGGGWDETGAMGNDTRHDQRNKAGAKATINHRRNRFTTRWMTTNHWILLKKIVETKQVKRCPWAFVSDALIFFLSSVTWSTHLPVYQRKVYWNPFFLFLGSGGTRRKYNGRLWLRPSQ
jgi:hypothetical protein